MELHNSEVEVHNSQFLNALGDAAPDGTVLWTTAFSGDPEQAGTKWYGSAYTAQPRCVQRVDQTYIGLNTYYSVSAFRPAENEEVKRRIEYWARLLTLVVDDVQDLDVVGSCTYILQTSPGKRQVGFFIDKDDPDAADAVLCREVTAMVASKGLAGGDRSGNNMCRLVRLPVGENQKPRASGHFQHRLEHWSPANTYTLEDACACIGLDLDQIKKDIREAPVTGKLPEGLQLEKLTTAISDIVRGECLHQSLLVISSSLVASGAHPGAVVNLNRALLNASTAPRDSRFDERYESIPRQVDGAIQKYYVTQPTFDPNTGEIVEQGLFVKASELLGNLTAAQFHVDGYLEKDAIAVMYGPSGVGKSFIAYDLALCIATGTRWHNCAVEQGPVCILAGEGHNGIGRRVAAWSKHRKVGVTDETPLFISRKAVRLMSQAAAQILAEEIEKAVAVFGRPPSLVVVDTLARNFEGDENSSKDVGAFIDTVDALVRKRWPKCSILIVHHTGHDSTRARGSSALKSGVDQEFAISKRGPGMTLDCTKMKDAETPAGKAFKIKQIDLGLDRNGIPMNGAVSVSDSSPLEYEICKRDDGGSVLAGDVIKAVLRNVTSNGAIAIEVGATISDRLSRALARMVEDQLLKLKGTGRGSSYALTSAAEKICADIGWM